MRAEVVDALKLERVVREAPLGLDAVHLVAHEGVFLRDDLEHLRFEGGEVVRREGPLDLEIVVEPVVDRGPEPDPGIRPQPPHGRRQNMGRGVAQHLEGARVLLRQDDEVPAGPQRGHQVLHDPVDRDSDRVPCKARTDRFDHRAWHRALDDLARVAVREDERQHRAHGRASEARSGSTREP